MEMHSFQELLNKNKHLAEVKNEGLDAINAIRKQHGKEPYLPNEQLNIAAGGHCLWMSSHNSMSHSEKWLGGGPGERLTAAGFKWTSYGENICFGQETVEEAVQCWLGDIGHRRNNLSSMKYAALFSSTASDGRKYWTLDVGDCNE